MEVSMSNLPVPPWSLVVFMKWMCNMNETGLFVHMHPVWRQYTNQAQHYFLEVIWNYKCHLLSEITCLILSCTRMLTLISRKWLKQVVTIWLYCGYYYSLQSLTNVFKVPLCSETGFSSCSYSWKFGSSAFNCWKWEISLSSLKSF